MQQVTHKAYGPFIFLVGALVFLGIALSLISYQNARGQAVPNQVYANLSGFAWSDNVGWISFNCLNTPGGCTSATGNYGVTIPTNPPSSTDISRVVPGPLSGFAWSDNIGWINFAPGPGPDGYPVGPATDGRAARVEIDATSGLPRLQGWARACSVFADMPSGNPNAPSTTTCSGTLKNNSLRGDWDGWISLSGTAGAGAYTVQFDRDGKVNISPQQKYAWGSDVVGWVNFRPVCADSGNQPTCKDTAGVYLGRPPLAAECFVTQNKTTSPVEATWYAQPSGGDGNYQLEWVRRNANDIGPDVVTTNPYAVKHVYDVPSLYERSLRVRSYKDGVFSEWIESSLCRNPSRGNSTGVLVTQLEPDFSLGVTPALDVSFLGNQTEAETGMATVQIDSTPVEFSRRFRSPVTVTVDKGCAGSGCPTGMGPNDIYIKKGNQVTTATVYMCLGFGTCATSATSVTVPTPTINVGQETIVYQPVSIKLVVKEGLARGSYTIPVSGLGDSLTRSANPPLILRVDTLGSAVEEF